MSKGKTDSPDNLLHTGQFSPAVHSLNIKFACVMPSGGPPWDLFSEIICTVVKRQITV